MGMRGITEFFNGFNQAYDTAGRVLTDFELAKIAKAQPTTTSGYSADDGDQLHALANAKDAEGKPYYTVGADASGNYQVTPNFQVGGQPAAPVTMARQGLTDFLGQRTNGAMSEAQVNNARLRAMAGVIAKHNPLEGMRLMRDVTQGEREDQRFAWEKTRTERDNRRADRQDADEETLRRIDAETGDWLSNRLKGADGAQRPATVDDHLAASQFRASRLMESGRAAEAGAAMKDFNAQSLVKIQLESAQRDQALGKTAAALSAGDLNAVKDFYNSYVPDGARVVSVTRDGRGQISINRETMDGRAMAPTVMKDTGQLLAAMTAFKDPMALYNWSQNEFKNNLALKQDARDDKRVAFEGQRVGMEGARLGIAAAADRRAQDDHAAMAPERQARGEIGKLKIELANLDTNNPADKKRESEITAKLSALATGTRGAMAGHDPADVQKARALVASGTYGDMQTALDGIINKPDQTHKAFVERGLQNMMKPSDAVKSADEAMSAMGWKRSGARWTKAAGVGDAGASIPPPDKREVGKSYDTPKGKMVWRGNGWEPAGK